MNYKTEIDRYGFVIEFEVEKEHAGFYWKAAVGDKEEVGKIDYQIMGKRRKIFVDTSFTPLNVDIFPVFSNSKYSLIRPVSIFPGEWRLKFSNVVRSSGSLVILGAKEKSYEGIELAKLDDLTNPTFLNIDLQVNNVLDKIFFKKSNYSEQPIRIGDISLINHKKNRRFIVHESLISLEYEGIVYKNKIVEFTKNSTIWSFFTVQFFEV